MAKVTASFTLDSQRDGDIIRWLDNRDSRKRSEEIRAALRASMRGDAPSITLTDLHRMLNEVQTAIDELKKSGVEVRQAVEMIDEEDLDLAANLDSLGA